LLWRNAVQRLDTEFEPATRERAEKEYDCVNEEDERPKTIRPAPLRKDCSLDIAPSAHNRPRMLAFCRDARKQVTHPVAERPDGTKGEFTAAR
jgi:hypothetical protein